MYSDNPILKDELGRHAEQFDTLFDLVKNEDDLVPYLNIEWIKEVIILGFQCNSHLVPCKPSHLR